MIIASREAELLSSLVKKLKDDSSSSSNSGNSNSAPKKKIKKLSASEYLKKRKNKLGKLLDGGWLNETEQKNLWTHALAKSANMSDSSDSEDGEEEE